MQKYNFFDLKGKILPKDVNEPVHIMLEEALKCPEASKALRKLEHGMNCGEVQIFIKDSPKYVRIKVNYGMVEGYDLIEDVDTEKVSFSVLKHIKNPLLSMKKPERKNQNAGYGSDSAENS